MDKVKVPITRVGITMRVDVCREGGEKRDSIDQRLLLWVQSMGGIPLLVPNNIRSDSEANQWLKNLKIDALVLSGGNDLGDAPDRDSTELHLLEAAKELEIAVLGICRGMQLMASFFGVGVEELSSHVGTRHQIYGDLETEVNSFHRFCIEACPPGFSVLASDEKGAIEAIKHNILPWEAWMWHPERESVFRQLELDRFYSLISHSPHS